MNSSLPADPSPMASGHETLVALADLLEQEYAAFKQADGAAVTAIAATKRRLTETLSRLETTSDGQIEPADSPRQEQTADLARHCRDLNRRNGQLLALQQGMLTRAMRVLMGTEQTPALYSASGESRPQVGSRHIASV